MDSINNEVKKLLEETKIWVLSTCGDKPNAVPVFFTTIKDDVLILYDVFMNKTLDNIKKNDNVSITVFNDDTLEGYQIKGKASYTSGLPLVEAGNAITKQFNLQTKGALIVRAYEVYVLTPGLDNGKLIYNNPSYEVPTM